MKIDSSLNLSNPLRFANCCDDKIEERFTKHFTTAGLVSFQFPIQIGESISMD